MYPGHWAKVTPEKAALVMAGSGERVTYAELDERSIRLARLLAAEGLRPGDHLAVFMENHPRFFEVVWAGLRSGLLITPVNRYLTADEAAYIVDDCGAAALVTTAALGETAEAMIPLTPGCRVRLAVGRNPERGPGPSRGHLSYDEALAAQPAEPLPAQPRGEFMLYSSGTTGQPKGISRPLTGGSITDGFPLGGMLGGLFRMDQDTVYLSPAPLYHSAPLGFSVGVQALGGTVVVMESFDPASALAAIEEHRVTHSQWVPTMFSRMLKLPEEERTKRDLTSHRVAIHAAAPCPVGVKAAMLEWWGPIIHEYYGGSELNGLTYVGPQDWLARPGTVGRPVLGVIHICDDDGNDLPAGEVGTVYFELPERPFVYHNDPEQTAQSAHRDHPNWTALGDVGRLDEDGFLYLTDRATFMIISGGVNIYPQEVENCLILHPAVDDVAVIGVPDDDMGEAVKAVVQPVASAVAGPELEAELLAFARERLTRYKCPRSVDFDPALPRLPTGKLYKRVLRDRYWAGREGRL